jgi:group I intron endonuclease
MSDKYRHNQVGFFMIQSGIYRVTNILNEDCYVGSSSNIPKRWKEHLYHSKRIGSKSRYRLHYAIAKYGEENFLFEVIEEVAPVKELLIKREQNYIDLLRPEYNIAPFAGSRLGIKASPEAIANMMGHLHSAEWKALASIRRTAFLLDPINQQINRERRLGKVWDELFGPERSAEIRGRMSEKRKLKPVVCAGWNRGIPMTAEQKKKINVPFTQERRRAISAAKTGQIAWNKGHVSEETLRKQSEKEARKLLPKTSWNAGLTTGPRSAETKERIGTAHRGIEKPSLRKPRSDETKRRMSQALTGKVRLDSRGKVGPNSKNGHYGISWRKDSEKWQVRLPSEQSPKENRKFGSYTNLNDALARRDEILAVGVDNAVANSQLPPPKEGGLKG